MINDDECGAVGEMRIVRGNQNTGRKPVPVPGFPQKIPCVQTGARTRAAEALKIGNISVPPPAEEAWISGRNAWRVYCIKCINRCSEVIENYN
jgi:hypothetical protein